MYRKRKQTHSQDIGSCLETEPYDSSSDYLCGVQCKRPSISAKNKNKKAGAYQVTVADSFVLKFNDRDVECTSLSSEGDGNDEEIYVKVLGDLVKAIGEVQLTANRSPTDSDVVDRLIGTRSGSAGVQELEAVLTSSAPCVASMGVLPQFRTQ